jgi:hypothetical protein
MGDDEMLASIRAGVTSSTSVKGTGMCGTVPSIAANSTDSVSTSNTNFSASDVVNIITVSSSSNDEVNASATNRSNDNNDSLDSGDSNKRKGSAKSKEILKFLTQDNSLKVVAETTTNDSTAPANTINTSNVPVTETAQNSARIPTTRSYFPDFDDIISADNDKSPASSAQRAHVAARPRQFSESAYVGGRSASVSSPRAGAAPSKTASPSPSSADFHSGSPSVSIRTFHTEEDLKYLGIKKLPLESSDASLASNGRGKRDKGAVNYKKLSKEDLIKRLQELEGADDDNNHVAGSAPAPAGCCILL